MKPINRINPSTNVKDWINPSSISSSDRPIDWPALDVLSATDQKFCGLFGVYDDDSSPVSLKMSVSSGTWTVNWGDGTIETGIASGTKKDHTYSFSGISAKAIDGKYKTVLVRAYPDSGDITLFSLNQVPAVLANANVPGINWLDLVISGPNITTLEFGGTIALPRVYSIDVLSSAITSTASLFYLVGAKYIKNFNTSGTITSITSTFKGAINLKKPPLFSFGTATNASNFLSDCPDLEELPIYDFSNITNASNLLGPSIPLGRLTSIPAWNFNSVTTTTSMFSYLMNVTNVDIYNIKVTISFSRLKLSKFALEKLFNNLGKPASTQTITITQNPGDDTVVSRSATTTSGSATVAIASTTGIAVGQLVTGTGISTGMAVTFQDSGDTVTRTAHGLANGKKVAFSSITSTTGISTYTAYYVINSSANTFQLSLTVGGSAIALTTDGSGTMLYGSYIQSYVTNTSFTLDVPASADGTNTMTFSILDTSIATLKNWTVSR